MPLRQIALLLGLLLSGMLAGPCSSTGGDAAGGEGPDMMALSSVAGTGDRDLRVVSELPTPQNTADGTERPIAPGDILEVSVFQVPDLSRTVQVDDAGRVSLPLIGVVPAAGKSVRTFENDIILAYGRDYLQSPQISVFVKESAANRVTVDGEVRRAGVFPLPPSSTLQEANPLAGAFSNLADEINVNEFRQK